MSFNLPEELLFQILIRLPPKSLIRFLTICKLWFSTITSSNFISSYTQHNHDVGNYHFLLRQFHHGQQREIYTLHDENDEFKIIRELVCPFKAQQEYFTIVGFVRGLICLWDESHELNPVIIWNPFIRKCFHLPSLTSISPLDQSFPLRKVSFGFGYDDIANDYKILRLTYSIYSCVKVGNKVKKRVVSFVDVFALKNRLWRRVSNSTPIHKLKGIPIFLNNTLHWLMPNDLSKNTIIVAFSLNNEVFVEITCPTNARLSPQLSHRIMVYSCDSLSLMDQWCEHKFHIWIMKEYGVIDSWNLMFSIDMDACLGQKHILGFSKSGGLVLVGNGQWVSYPSSQDVQIVDFEPMSYSNAPHSEVCMESLALLDEEHDGLTCLQLDDGDDKSNNHKSKIARKWL